MQLGLRLYKPLAWFMTFNFINITWVYFRAESWQDANKVLKGMFAIGDQKFFNFSIGFIDTLSMWLNAPLYDWLPFAIRKARVEELSLFLCAMALILVLCFNNNNPFSRNKSISYARMTIAAALFSIAIVQSFTSTTEVFLYFNF